MKTRFVFAILAASTLMGGCARMLTPQGDDKYDCNRKENPNSPYCHSFKAIDTATKAPLPETKYDSMTNMAVVDKLTGVAPTGNSSSSEQSNSQSSGRAPVFYSSIQQSNGSDSGYAQKQPRDGMPIREAAPIQRVWVKKHRDSSDRLIGTTVVYAELGQNRWAGFDQPGQAGRADAVASKRVVPHVASNKPESTTNKPQPDSARSESEIKFQQPGSRAVPGENLEQRPASEQMGETELPN